MIMQAVILAYSKFDFNQCGLTSRFSIAFYAFLRSNS
jgi:hypothetical protein